MKSIEKNASKDSCCWQKQSINNPRTLHVHHKIAEMMALDFQPYSIVTDSGFAQLLKTLQPSYTSSSR